MEELSFDNATIAIGLTALADVFDQSDLFELIDNDAVMTLSSLGGQAGFSSTKAIRKSTGINQRRILRNGAAPIDLALALCGRLEDVTRDPISAYSQVFLCHSHTDPHASERLGRQLESELKLPAGTIQAFNFGCSGFLKLLTEGTLALEQGGEQTKVALLSVETPQFWHDGSDRLFCGIVSAGATAAVLEVGAGLPLLPVRSDDFLVPMERRPNPDPLFRMETGEVFDFRGRLCHKTVMRMNPEPVFLNGIELMLDNLRSALLSIDRQPGERIIVAPHQPSAKLLKALVAAAQQEFPDVEFLNNLELYGNMISSSVPTLVSRLSEVMHRNGLAPIAEGDHLVLLAAGICMTEIENHMSAGHACLRWQDGILNSDRAQVTVSTAAAAAD